MARILTLTNWFPPHSRGGYEAVCQDVMSQLAQRGHTVEVLCSDERLPGVDDPGSTLLPVHRRLKMYWRNDRPWIPSMRRQLAMERHNQAALAAVLDELQPEVVSVWHMAALPLNLLTTLIRRRIPIVYAIHDDWLTYALGFDPWGRRWTLHPRLAVLAERWTGVPGVIPDLGTSGTFTFVSESVHRRALADSPWSLPDSCVVHAGIHREGFPPAGSVPRAPWSWRLLFMGRLDPRKGTETTVRALARLPEAATLSMVGWGDPDEVSRLQALAHQLGVADRVKFWWVDRSEVPAVYLSHDCVVFPSEWEEPFGLVPLEAMACGVPVVATATGGTGEFLTDGENCVRVAPGDPAALAQGISTLAERPELQDLLRTNGWSLAERFDVVHMTDAYERLHVVQAGRTGIVGQPTD